MKLIILLLFPLIIFAQSGFETGLDAAYQNAKKGVYWALSNIPDSKSKLDNELIVDDKLISKIKLTKEVNGVKVEVKGYYESYEVSVTLYRSFDILKKEGYLETDSRK